MSTTTETVIDSTRRSPVITDADQGRRMIALWLLVTCTLVVSMVVLGGVTRLTGSGLSMVTWKPIHGVVPPMGADQWQEEFARYQESPQYREINQGMGMADFKRIFWFEYAHRLLGRSVGMVFVLGFGWLLWRRLIPARLIPHLIAMFVLGGAQGLLGWWMVRSGLVDVPHVSAYRLAAHLGLAVALYLWMFLTALSLLRVPDSNSVPCAPMALVRAALALLLLAFVTIISGAFVAGLHAGLVYNTFPSMGGHWIPPEIAALSPWWRNLFENVATVQFDHRVLALTLFTGVIGLWIVCLIRDVATPVRRWVSLAAVAVFIQAGLGVATLLLHVPTVLAALHQANALVLLSVLAVLAFELMRGRPMRSKPAGPRQRAPVALG